MSLLRRTGRTLDAIRWSVRERRERGFSPRERVERRDERVRDVVAFAHREVPFYRDAMRQRGLEPGDLRVAEDLALLPILEAGDVKDRESDLLPRGREPGELIDLKSSGSSGVPRTVYHDVRGALRVVAIAGQRERRLLARTLGGPVRRIALLLHERDDHLDVSGALRSAIALPSRWMPVEEVISSRAGPEEIAEALDRFGPDVLHGYGSSIGELFRYLDREGAKVRLPRVVTFTSDGLSRAERALIEERFGIPVHGAYRSVESLMLGFECGLGEGYHVNDDLFAVRIVDEGGRALPPGEIGDVVVSNLVGRGSVLLNYRIDDRAEWIGGACPCGSPLPRLSLVEGRTSLMVELPDGTRVHPFEFVGGVFTDLPVWRWQIVQESPDRFAVRVVPVSGADGPTLAREISDRFGTQTRGDLEVEVRFVDRIPRSEGGKVLPLAFS